MRGRKSNCDSKSQSGLSLLLPPCMWRETRRAPLSARVKGIAMHAFISAQMREEGPAQKKKEKKTWRERCGWSHSMVHGGYPQRREYNAEQRILSPSQRGFISVGYIWTEDASPVAGGRHAGWVITFFSFLFLFFFFLLWQRGNQSSLYA